MAYQKSTLEYKLLLFDDEQKLIWSLEDDPARKAEFVAKKFERGDKYRALS